MRVERGDIVIVIIGWGTSFSPPVSLFLSLCLSLSLSNTISFPSTSPISTSLAGCAVGFNRIAIVKLLLDGRAFIEQRDKKGNTALHYAAGYGRIEVLQMLLKAGAVVNAKNDDGQTPKDVAMLNGEVTVVKMLNDTNNDGQNL